MSLILECRGEVAVWLKIAKRCDGDDDDDDYDYSGKKKVTLVSVGVRLLMGGIGDAGDSTIHIVCLDLSSCTLQIVTDLF